MGSRAGIIAVILAGRKGKKSQPGDKADFKAHEVGTSPMGHLKKTISFTQAYKMEKVTNDFIN